MMSARILSFAAVLLLGGRVSARAADQIKPSPTPIAWELNTDCTAPNRIVVDLGKGSETYWYMLYTVVNNTGEDVDFHPDIVRVDEVETEHAAAQAAADPDNAPALTAHPALVGPHPAIFRAIQQRHAKTHPFLVSPVHAIGRLLQGKDNARTSVAIFRDLDPRVSRFTIYFGGLSGERVSRRNPLYDPRRAAAAKGASDGDKDAVETIRVFVLQKTLAMPFTIPGDVKTRREATPVLGRMEWVMR